MNERQRRALWCKGCAGKPAHSAEPPRTRTLIICHDCLEGALPENISPCPQCGKYICDNCRPGHQCKVANDDDKA